MAKGLFSHSTWIPSSGFCGSEQEHSSDYFTSSMAGKSVPLLWGVEKPDTHHCWCLTLLSVT